MQMVKALLLVTAAIAGLGASESADASVMINISEVGTNVTLTASGTFDQALATIQATGHSFGQQVFPSFGFAGFGTQSPVQVYALSGPSNFGSGNFSSTVDVNSGLGIGLNARSRIFFISSSYLNNSQISSSGVISNSTLASVGFTPGVYNFLIGGNALTVNISPGTGAVPEPGTWAMMLLGFSGIGYSIRRRRRSAAIAQFA